MGIGKKGNFADLVAKGENPNGVRTEGAFGVSHGGIGEDYFTEFNFAKNSAGPRWGGPAVDGIPSGGPVIGPDAKGGSENIGEKLKGGR